MKIYTKDELIKALKDIRDQGPILSNRTNNHGSIGNTLENLLGITENNLPIPNAAEWELKTQRLATTSLTTLFHTEPSPQAMKLVPSQLLPLYGWKHKEAGKKYSENEKSFRQTIHGNNYSDRGFKVIIDERQKKILISFKSSEASQRHAAWLKEVKQKIGLEELNPQPYWGFDDLFHKAGTKLLNCFFVQAKIEKSGTQELYHYTKITMLQKFSMDNFLQGIKEGFILIDFDARTGHNHGTKFRIRQNYLPKLYTTITEI